MIFATPQTALASSHILYLHDVVSNITCSSGGINNQMDSTIGANPITQRLDATEDWWIEASNPRTIPAGNWQVIFDATTSGGGGPAGKVTVTVQRVANNCSVPLTIINEEITMEKGTTMEYSTASITRGQITVNSGERIIVIFEKTGGGTNRLIDLRYGGSNSFDDSYLETPGGPPPPPPPPTDLLYVRFTDSSSTCSANGVNKDLSSITGPYVKGLKLDSNEDSWSEPSNPRTTPAANATVTYLAS